MIGVYTANFGSYDPPFPAKPTEGVVYRYFTDTPIEVSGWDVQVVEKPCAGAGHSSRYYFDQSCLVMPDCEYTILHGANARLVADPVALINKYLQSTDLALFKHPHRNCIYDEADIVVMMGKDTKANVDAHMARIAVSGMPRHWGLSTCIFMIRRNTLVMRAFEDAWWQMVSTGSYRDQLSFDFIRWKMNFPVTYIPGDPYTSEHIFKVERHH